MSRGPLSNQPECQSASPTINPHEWTARELLRFVSSGQLSAAVADAEVRTRPTRDLDWKPGDPVVSPINRDPYHLRQHLAITPGQADQRFKRGDVQVFEKVRRG